MSLDVHLTSPEKRVVAHTLIVDDGGKEIEIDQWEWCQRYPHLAPLRIVPELAGEALFDRNITHNLTRMADEAGIYQVVWRPDEHGIIHARQLIEPLRAGLALLRAEPERFRAFNPANGWGDYEGLVRFVDAYLKACEEWPEAEVRANG